MKNIIYLDNSATTKPCEKAIEYMNKALLDNWGNPSSLHTLGINAEDILLSAKDVCAKAIGARSDEIFFTSGGTEANNLAINGAVLSRAKRGILFFLICSSISSQGAKTRSHQVSSLLFAIE